jgi:hypothetical protein
VAVAGGLTGDEPGPVHDPWHWLGVAAPGGQDEVLSTLDLLFKALEHTDAAWVAVRLKTLVAPAAHRGHVRATRSCPTPEGTSSPATPTWS